MIQAIVNILVILWLLFAIAYPGIVAGGYVGVLLIAAFIVQFYGIIQGRKS